MLVKIDGSSHRSSSREVLCAVSPENLYTGMEYHAVTAITAMARHADMKSLM